MAQYINRSGNPSYYPQSGDLYLTPDKEETTDITEAIWFSTLAEAEQFESVKPEKEKPVEPAQ